MAAIPAYAVLLKAHYWDQSVGARLEDLRRAAPAATILLFLDETRGPIPMPDLAVPILRHTEADAERAGLLPASVRSLFWYNTDYPLYLAAPALEAFDYVVMLEHDVVANVSLDALVMLAGEQAVDLIAAPIRGDHRNWFWLPTTDGVYAPGAVRPVLTCFCLLSRAALSHLFSRRVWLTQAYRAGVLQAQRPHPERPPVPGLVQSWPFSEAYMATELALNGFQIRDLSEYGSTAGYDWWPPLLDRALQSSPAAGFFHPVLAERQYVDSLIRSQVDLSEWRRSDSLFRSRLADCDPELVADRLDQELRNRGEPAATVAT